MIRPTGSNTAVPPPVSTGLRSGVGVEGERFEDRSEHNARGQGAEVAPRHVPDARRIHRVTSLQFTFEGFPAACFTAETQRPQRKKPQNRHLCELRVFAVNNRVAATPLGQFPAGPRQCLMPWSWSRL